MKRRVTYVISHVDRALAFEWIVEQFHGGPYELSFILLDSKDSFLARYLRDRGVRTDVIRYRGKRDIPRAFWEIFCCLRRDLPDIVHTHMWEASLLGLSAAWLAGIRTRVQTRHHSTFHHRYCPKMVKYDKLINRLATHLVAISENVRDVLIDKESVRPQKILIIHHGFNLEEFAHVPPARVKVLRDKFKISEGRLVLGVISRFEHLKGIQHIIPAFEMLLKKEPEALLVLAGANGSYACEIDSLLSRLPEPSYLKIVFENDLFALYQLFDIFIHVPIDDQCEAFGQTYVEPLAGGIPSIFTLSGVAREFIRNGFNAVVVDHAQPAQIHAAILQLMGDAEFKGRIIQNGLESVRERFPLQRMIRSLQELYD